MIQLSPAHEASVVNASSNQRWLHKGWRRCHALVICDDTGELQYPENIMSKGKKMSVCMAIKYFFKYLFLVF